MSKTQLRCFGDKGEETIANLLKKRGFSIVARNYNARVGEIDIIADKNDLMVFVEVKTRKQSYFPISCTVNRTKQLKLIKAAKHFVAQNKVVDKTLRFDVATLVGSDSCKNINYIENAFLA